jgi:hypothetical protein
LRLSERFIAMETFASLTTAASIVQHARIYRIVKPDPSRKIGQVRRVEMRTIFGIAAALTLAATVAPTAAQAQYYDQGYSRYDNGRGHDNYHGHDWRDRQRSERQRAREERRARLRWERAHRHDHRHHDYR